MKMRAVKAPMIRRMQICKQLRRSASTSQSRFFRSTASTRFWLAYRCAPSSERPRIWLATVRIKPMARAGNATRPGLCLSSLNKRSVAHQARCFELCERMRVMPRSRCLARRRAAAGRSSSKERMLRRKPPSARSSNSIPSCRQTSSIVRSVARRGSVSPCSSLWIARWVKPTRRPMSRCASATLRPIRSYCSLLESRQRPSDAQR